MRKVVRAYEKDNDMILQFLDDMCETAADSTTKAKTLYENYKLWARSNGYYVLSAKKFNAGMEQHPEWHAGRRVRDGYPVYAGLRIKQC